MAIGLCAKPKHIKLHILPVDMSKWVAYSLPLSVMNKLHSHEVGPILLASATSIYSLNLTKEAAHA